MKICRPGDTCVLQITKIIVILFPFTSDNNVFISLEEEEMVMEEEEHLVGELSEAVKR